jgi:uncharacterized protein (DUF58 family)
VLRPTVTALLGLGLCLVAATFDSASLYLPGVALIALVGLAVAWVLAAAAGARVRRRAGARTVVEGEPFVVELEVSLGPLPAPGGELREPLLDEPLPLGGRRHVRLRREATLARRGRMAVEPCVLVVRDPLRLARRTVSGEPGEELLVLPRVEPVSAPGDGGAAAGMRAGRGGGLDPLGRWRDDRADGLDLDGLRPYREGAPASRIHWATLARRGEMLERRFVAESASAPLIVLDPSAPAGDAALDSAVRAAASLCVALAQAGGCGLLLPGTRRPVAIGHDLGAWPGVHRRLALVEPGPAPTLTGLGARNEAILWVTAAELQGLPRALERLPARTRCVVAPTMPAGARTAFTVAGCSGWTLARSGSAAA